MSVNTGIEFNYACEAFILLAAFVREGKVVPELYDKEKINIFLEYFSKTFNTDPSFLKFLEVRLDDVSNGVKVEVKPEIIE